MQEMFGMMFSSMAGRTQAFNAMPKVEAPEEDVVDDAVADAALGYFQLGGKYGNSKWNWKRSIVALERNRQSNIVFTEYGAECCETDSASFQPHTQNIHGFCKSRNTIEGRCVK